MKQMKSAGIITYIIKDQTILYLLLRYTAGHWEFPKGTMEAGETTQETAMRELHEETGLTVDFDHNFEQTLSYSFTTYDNQITQKTVYFFTGKAISQNVLLSHEHIDYTWLPYDQAVAQLTYDNGKILLQKANEYIKMIT